MNQPTHLVKGVSHNEITFNIKQLNGYIAWVGDNPPRIPVTNEAQGWNPLLKRLRGILVVFEASLWPGGAATPSYRTAKLPSAHPRPSFRWQQAAFCGCGKLQMLGKRYLYWCNFPETKRT